MSYHKKWLAHVSQEEIEAEASDFVSRVCVGDTLKITGEVYSALCVGCGDGREISQLALLNKHLMGVRRLHGIDVNKSSAVKARGSWGFVITGDMHYLPYRDDSFELVYTRDTFEHSISHIQVISELARVSKKYVSIVLPDETWQRGEFHFIVPTTAQMLSLGEKAGLLLKSFRSFWVIVGASSLRQDIYVFQHG